MRHVVLLRAVNLGARNRVAMPALRELLTDAGYSDVRTYLQSGNVVLGSKRGAPAVASDCRRLIASGFELDIGVVVRTRAQLAAVVKRNPLADVANDPKRYLVSFLSDKLARATVKDLAALAVEGEELRVAGRELYAWLPRGAARSRLWLKLASPRLPVVATARNWSTTTKLLEPANDE